MVQLAVFQQLIIKQLGWIVRPRYDFRRPFEMIVDTIFCAASECDLIAERDNKGAVPAHASESNLTAAHRITKKMTNCMDRVRVSPKLVLLEAGG